MPRHRRPQTNVRLFHGRTAKKIKVTAGAEKNAGVSWGKETIVSIPDTSTAYGRTVRFHEAQHLNHTPKEGRPATWDMDPFVQMGIEDAIIHSDRCMPEDLPRSVVRDELCAALEDMRDVNHYLKFFAGLSAKGKEVDGTLWNKTMISALRSMSILFRNKTSIPDKVMSRLRTILPKSLDVALTQVLANSLSGDESLERMAGKMFEALLVTPQNPGKMRKPDKLIAPPDMPHFVRSETENDEADDHEREKGSGGNRELPMPVIRMKMTIPTKELKKPQTRHRSYGATPNMFKLARASFAPIQTLFKVRIMKPAGGAFLFDASGSMGVTQERLRSIAERVPAATVAFYSGSDDSSRLGGMWIFAENGMRTDASMPGVPGGNGWDYQALKWLLKQKGELHFVTDECFYGGRDNQAHRAAALLAMQLGKVTVYHSYDDIERALNKGEIRGAVK